MRKLEQGTVSSLLIHTLSAKDNAYYAGKTKHKQRKYRLSTAIGILKKRIHDLQWIMAVIVRIGRTTQKFRCRKKRSVTMSWIDNPPCTKNVLFWKNKLHNPELSAKSILLQVSFLPTKVQIVAADVTSTIVPNGNGFKFSVAVVRSDGSNFVIFICGANSAIPCRM